MSTIYDPNKAYDSKNNKYQTGYDLAVTESIFSSGVSWAGAGAGIGSFGGNLGQGIGAAAGFLGGMIFGGFTARADYRNKVTDDLRMMQIQRKKSTKERNYAILSGKNLISKTKAGFDTTYGADMYDKYNSLFTDMFKKNAKGESDTLNNIFTKMEYDTVAGDIQTRVGGINAKGLSYSMSLSDINEAYYEYFANEMRKADTEFGLTMQSLKAKEGEAKADYNNEVGLLNVEFSKQFYDTFIGRTMEIAEGELASGEAAAAQGASGLKGGHLKSLQQFRNDLAAVAYSSALDYLIGTYEGNMKTSQGSYINAISDMRHQADVGIAGQISQLINQYNEMNNELLGQFGVVRDNEGAIDAMSEEMVEAEDFLNKSSANVGASKIVMSSNIDGYNGNTMEDLF